MNQIDYTPLTQLSTPEIFSALLLYSDLAFDRQDIYRFFQSLEENFPPAVGRFGVREYRGKLRSESLDRLIDFAEMGKILDLRLPNPVPQPLQANNSQLQFLAKDLETRAILPKHEDFLKQLASQFQDLLKPSDNPALPRT